MILTPGRPRPIREKIEHAISNVVLRVGKRGDAVVIESQISPREGSQPTPTDIVSIVAYRSQRL